MGCLRVALTGKTVFGSVQKSVPGELLPGYAQKPQAGSEGLEVNVTTLIERGSFGTFCLHQPPAANKVGQERTTSEAC